MMALTDRSVDLWILWSQQTSHQTEEQRQNDGKRHSGSLAGRHRTARAQTGRAHDQKTELIHVY